MSSKTSPVPDSTSNFNSPTSSATTSSPTDYPTVRRARRIEPEDVDRYHQVEEAADQQVINELNQVLAVETTQQASEREYLRAVEHELSYSQTQYTLAVKKLDEDRAEFYNNRNRQGLNYHSVPSRSTILKEYHLIKYWKHILSGLHSSIHHRADSIKQLNSSIKFYQNRISSGGRQFEESFSLSDEDDLFQLSRTDLLRKRGRKRKRQTYIPTNTCYRFRHHTHL